MDSKNNLRLFTIPTNRVTLHPHHAYAAWFHLKSRLKRVLLEDDITLYCDLKEFLILP